MINAVLGSASETLNIGRILLDLTIILIVAKVAAEVSDRIHVPAVIGEIAAGILIGPSVLGLVNTGDMLFFLAELGVILLLIQVGLETDIIELKSVGRASILVAIIGVVLPMALGFGASSLLGESINTSLFVGAALTATSIGITARVFGDLRALATVEARTVLGAAVVDDVLGLIILTVVTRVVEQGTVGIGTIASTIGLAIGFLAVTSTVGFTIFPQLFARIAKGARSASTVSVVAIGIALGFSVLADKAHLAPIIGAFVAGLALRRIAAHERVERDVSSIAQIFVPIFFLNIGITTDIRAMADPRVLGIALLLSVIAIITKIAAALGALGSRGDKWTIGFGMLPRGEVGLIFASIGLSVGALSKELYGSVLVVVLVTTLIAPPLLRWRLGKQAEAVEDQSINASRPLDGWVKTIDGQIVLNGSPPVRSLVEIGLATASLAVDARPSSQLLDWFALHRNATLSWNDDATIGLLRVLRNGSARSWRFLDVTSVITRALPEVATAIRARRGDASELDPTHLAQMPTVEALRTKVGRATLADSSLLLAAFIYDFSTDRSVVSLVDRLSLPPSVRHETRSLLSASALMYATCTTEPYETNTRVLAQLADFLGSPLMVERCRLLTEARGDLEDWQFSTLIEIVTGVQELLAHPELIEGLENSLEAVRRRDAIALTSNPLVIDRIEHAAAVYILAHEADVLVRHATLVEPAPRSRTARVSVHETNTPHEWEINIATRDMRGLLARICAVLAERGLEIISADLATWPDSAVLDSFIVRSVAKPNATQIAFELERKLRSRLENPRRLMQSVDAQLNVRLDNDAHPWHSVLTVTGADQPGLVQAVATALAKANINVHHARITTKDNAAADRFEVSTRHGRKVGDQALQKVISSLS